MSLDQCWEHEFRSHQSLTAEAIGVGELTQGVGRVRGEESLGQNPGEPKSTDAAEGRHGRGDGCGRTKAGQ